MLPNAYTILGVIAHFINKQGKRRNVILKLCEVIGEHTSKNIAAVLLKVFKDYKISNNIGYFIANNADLNDTYINAILDRKSVV